MNIRPLIDPEYNNITSHLAFSPTVPILAVGSYPGSVRLWDIESGTNLELLIEAPDAKAANPASFAFSSDGKYLVTGPVHEDDSFHIWDMTSRSVIDKWQGAGTECFAWSSGNQCIAFGSDNIRIRNLVSRSEVLLGESPASVWRIAWSPNGQLIAGGCYEGLVLWDVVTREPLSNHRIFGSETRGLGFRTDDIVLVFQAYQLVEWYWRENVIKSILDIPDGQGEWLTCMSDDGRLVAYFHDDSAYAVDAESGQHIFAITPWNKYIDTPSSIAFSPDAKRLAFGDYIGGVWVCDLGEEN